MSEPWTLEWLKEEREAARKYLLQLLRAPYNRMSPYAIHRACEYLEHPVKYEDVPERGCPCGKFPDQLRVEPAKKRHPVHRKGS